MTPDALTAYLRSNIPLTAAMAVEAVSVAPEAVVLRAPLAPNINHRQTVFGGSASALAIVAAWSLVHLRLEAGGVPHRLVIQRNTMSYEAPMSDTFTAIATLPPDSDWDGMLATFARRRKARIAAVAALVSHGRPTGRLEADFVVLAAE